jgi:hypothetical protein
MRRNVGHGDCYSFHLGRGTMEGYYAACLRSNKLLVLLEFAVKGAGPAHSATPVSRCPAEDHRRNTAASSRCGVHTN